MLGSQKFSTSLSPFHQFPLLRPVHLALHSPSYAEMIPITEKVNDHCKWLGCGWIRHRGPPLTPPKHEATHHLSPLMILLYSLQVLLRDIAFAFQFTINFYPPSSNQSVLFGLITLPPTYSISLLVFEAWRSFPAQISLPRLWLLVGTCVLGNCGLANMADVHLSSTYMKTHASHFQ